MIGGRIQTYPAALAFWLAQRKCLAARARDLGAVGEQLRFTLRVRRGCEPESRLGHKRASVAGRLATIARL